MSELIPVPSKYYLILNSQVVPLQSETLTIGRHLENDLVIQNQYISRQHAAIQYENGEFVIYDQGARSGIFVNNKRITRCVLCSGDMITLANVQIMFVHDQSQLKRVATKDTTGLDSGILEG